MLCAALGYAAWLVQELLYRDVFREPLSLGRTLELCSLATEGAQEPEALKIFTAVYHLSHS